jgi:hypothetical protein
VLAGVLVASACGVPERSLEARPSATSTGRVEVRLGRLDWIGTGERRGDERRRGDVSCLQIHTPAVTAASAPLIYSSCHPRSSAPSKRLSAPIRSCHPRDRHGPNRAKSHQPRRTVADRFSMWFRRSISTLRKSRSLRKSPSLPSFTSPDRGGSFRITSASSGNSVFPVGGGGETCSSATKEKRSAPTGTPRICTGRS